MSDIEVSVLEIPAPADVTVFEVANVPEIADVPLLPVEVEIIEASGGSARMAVMNEAIDGETYWYGGIIGAAWKINRFVFSAGILDKNMATMANNPAIQTLNDAWDSRTSLVYT